MATQGRTSARYPLHARLSPQDSVALLQKRKEKKAQSMFSCKSCTDDGDDAPSGKAANGIMMNARVAEAISAAKKAEQLAFVKKQQMEYEREAREMTEAVLAQVQLEQARAEERLKQTEDDEMASSVAGLSIDGSTGSPVARRQRSMSMQSDGDLSGIDTDGEDDYYD